MIDKDDIWQDKQRLKGKNIPMLIMKRLYVIEPRYEPSKTNNEYIKNYSKSHGTADASHIPETKSEIRKSVK